MSEPIADAFQIWSYMSQQPLLWLCATLFAYWIGEILFVKAGRNPLVNAVLIAIVLLGVLLHITGTSYETYFDGAQFVHFMLGPVTVCLAIPLQANLLSIRKALIPIMAALVVGSVTSIVVALGVAKLLGADQVLLATIAPKSVTTPVAIGIAEGMGGDTALTAVLVIITGTIGAICVTPLLNLLRIKDWRARGFAVGVVSHGFGTARAFQVNDTAGVFASTGMGLNAVLTAFVAPLVLHLFF